jgi:hypothetical protein
MITRNSFSDLSQSLSSGFFADNAVFVLSKAKKGSSLSKQDKDVLKDISSFLLNVLKGFNWSDNPRFSSRTATSAAAFSQAVQVTLGQDPQAFPQTIKSFIELTKDVLNEKRVSQTSLQHLIDFFTAIGKSQLERTDDIINVRTASGSRRMFSL